MGMTKSGVPLRGALCSVILAIAFTPSRAKADDSSVSHVVASGWMATDFHDRTNPGCSIGSDASAPGGRLMMGANRRRPDPMNLIIRKTEWLIPAGTQVQVKASFPDGSIIGFNGRGNGQTIKIDIATDQLRGWLHELTSSAAMQIVFGGNEPPWTFDLSGTTAVVNAMGDCFRDHQINGVAPPFDTTTVAGGEATQPFSVAQATQTPGPAPARPSQPFRETLSPLETSAPKPVGKPLKLTGEDTDSGPGFEKSVAPAPPASNFRLNVSPQSTVQDAPADPRCNAPLYGSDIVNYNSFVTAFAPLVEPNNYLKMVCDIKFGDRMPFYNLGFSDEDIDLADTANLAIGVMGESTKYIKQIKERWGIIIK